MDTSFLDISNNLVKSDFNQSILDLFQIKELGNITDHVAAFIGCDPFRAELSRLQDDLEKFKEFQIKNDELVQDSLNNEEGNQAASIEFINKMKTKWIESQQWD